MLLNVARINVRTQRRAGYLARCSYLTLTLVVGAAAIGCVAAPRAALAADWVGGNSTNWFDPGNWNPTAVPTAADNTVINNAPASFALVDGSAATANNVTVGQSANGILQLQNGGTLNSTTGIIGDQAGSSGTVKLFDSGSTWTNSGNLTIGKNGDGQLIVHSGTTVSNATGTIGVNAGSTGFVEVSGTGATWTNSGILNIGTFGTARLDVLNGGAVSSNQGFIGFNGSANGTMTVDGVGSIWTNSAFLQVGSSGTGHLTISNGGAVRNTFASIGAGAGSGTVDVTGAGSTWTNNGDLTVGQLRSGTLNILNGGVVSNAVGNVGESAGSTGTVKVDGLGSTWINSSILFVGNDGTAYLTISNGGKVQNTYSSVGVGNGSGAVDVTGAGSTWINSADLSVGTVRSGTLNISNGGAVSNLVGYVGDSAGATGAVKVDGLGSTWTNSSDLIVGSNGTGTLTISNGGVASAPGVSLAKNAGSTGTINIGAAAGTTATGAGKLNAATLQVGAGTGTLNFNHTEASYSFDAAMSGNGTINQLAGNTDLTANSSGFTGMTDVQGGRLAVNGSLANSLVTVSGNGVLGGNGIVGGINAQAGGIIAPGNSIGTLNVNGNLNQAAGSVYQVELTSTGQSDLIHATGTATIANGALLSVVKLDAAPLVVGTHYTVLQADGGVTGTYTMFSPSTFIGFAASYDPTHVYLDVTQAKSFASVGLTRNQIATGAATEALAAGNPVYDAVLMSQTDGAARTAFDQLSGDIHASVKGVLLDDSRFPREAAINRLRSAFGSVGASLSPVMAYASSGPVSVAPDTDRFAVWGQSFGSWGQWRSDGNAAGLNRSTGGFISGADGLVFDTWRVGLFGGYSRTSFDGKDRSSTGSSDNYHVGLYDGAQWGNLAVRSGLAYTWHDLSTNRNVAFPGFSDALKGNYNAGTAQVFGELGYSIKAGQVGFEPFANLAYVSLRTDGFTETGGAAALTSSRATSDATFTTLGLRASSNFTLGTVNATARGSLGWRHAFGDTTPLSALAFASGGSVFTIAGVPIAQDAVVTDVGLDFNVTRDTIFGISFNNQSGSGVTDQTIRANFSAKF